jgi:hypothetical protein
VVEKRQREKAFLNQREMEDECTFAPQINDVSRMAPARSVSLLLGL